MKNILIKGLFVGASIIFVVSSASAMTCTNLTKSLAKGSENSEVLKLQQFLFDSGYLTAKPNGYFGNATMIALKKFQGASGLAQVGSVGPGTRGKVKEVSCGKASLQEKSISSSQKSKIDTHVTITETNGKDNENITTTSNDDTLYFPKNGDGIFSIKNIKYYLVDTYATKLKFLASEFEEKAIDKNKINITCNKHDPQYSEKFEQNIFSSLKVDKDIVDIKNYYLSIKEIKDKKDANELFKIDKTLPDTINKQRDTSEAITAFFKKNTDSLEKEFNSSFKTKVQNSVDRALSKEMSRQINLCRINKNSPLLEVTMEDSLVLKNGGLADFMFFMELLLGGNI